jgi:hypothetical protein
LIEPTLTTAPCQRPAIRDATRPINRNAALTFTVGAASIIILSTSSSDPAR